MRTIDLDGPEGNAFWLLGTARSTARQLEMTPEETRAILEDMQSSDYNHLCKVFTKHFGNLYELVGGDEDFDDESE